MTLARKAAEAVCAGAEELLPERLRASYRKSDDLGRRLGFLEDNAKERIPGEVLAALRTLQAYGNYATHYHPEQHRPSERATASAMASLDVAARWFLALAETAGANDVADIALRSPPPPAPSFFERRRIL